jgi:hypothetical protein
LHAAECSRTPSACVAIPCVTNTHVTAQARTCGFAAGPPCYKAQQHWKASTLCWPHYEVPEANNQNTVQEGAMCCDIGWRCTAVNLLVCHCRHGSIHLPRLGSPASPHFRFSPHPAPVPVPHPCTCTCICITSLHLHLYLYHIPAPAPAPVPVSHPGVTHLGLQRHPVQGDEGAQHSVAHQHRIREQLRPA